MALVFLASLWIITWEGEDGASMPDELHVWNRILSGDHAPLLVSDDLTHDEDKFCIATVDDGNVTTASVIGEGGHFSLALPKNYETQMTLDLMIH